MVVVVIGSSGLSLPNGTRPLVCGRCIHDIIPVDKHNGAVGCRLFTICSVENDDEMAVRPDLSGLACAE